MVSHGDDGVITDARLAFCGAGPTPIRARQAEALLIGERPTEALFREAGERVRREIDPDSDIQASADYRREVAAVLARRALTRATGAFAPSIR